MVIATENTICCPLCKLFNLSLRKKCFPSFWKIASVTAVLKKSVKSITSNYKCGSRQEINQMSFMSCSGFKYSVVKI
jgi:hypothetical protein